MSQGSVPSVSVVMPAYNAEKYLREAIDSILAQTYTDFELIIINDGSTDKTKEIILSYSDPRIVYLENEKNSGICVTLNKGLDAAHGKYIARMDSDDISLPERFEKQVKFMETNTQIGLLGSHLQLIDEYGNYKYIFENAHNNDECWVNMLFATCVGHPSVMIRRSCLEEHNLRYNDYFRGMEDYYLWWQMGKYTKISNIQEPLILYRCHTNQVTKNQINDNFKKRQREFLVIRLTEMGLDLNNSEINILNQYLVDKYNYDDEMLLKFIYTLKNVYVQLTNKNPKIKNILKLYIAKAVSLIMDKSKNSLHKSRIYYTNKTFLIGCMPFIWWVKRSYHYLLGH